MMSSDLYFRDKISVAVLGATSLIGQKLVERLARHPWFNIIALCEVGPFVGQLYEEVVPSSSLPKSITSMKIISCEPSFKSSLVFSALHPENAPAIEVSFAEHGYFVLSHFTYPLNQGIPQIVANVNPDHLTLLKKEPFAAGGIISTPHELVIELTLVLKPIIEQFGLETVQAIVLQPLSNKEKLVSYPEKLRNVPGPFLQELETQVENESLRVLGKLQENEIENANVKIKTQYMRLLDIKEHVIELSIKLRNKVDTNHLIQAWNQFASGMQRLQLPTAPYHAVSYFHTLDHLQAHLSSLPDIRTGVKIANLSSSPTLDYQFTLIPASPTTTIAESVLQNAELLVAHGKIYW